MRRAFVLVLVLGLCVVTVDGALAMLPPGGTFTDDDGNIHEGNIEAIAADGITNGCNPPTNDLYCPSSTVTRGQMAAFLARALTLPSTGTDFFSDDDGTTFEDDINRLAAAGTAEGCDPPANTRFCPNETVTRGQMAAFLVRALGYTDDGGGDLFVDDDASIFEGDIDRLGTAGVTKGCNPPTNDRYCPDDPVRRDEMASFLSRALGLSPITPPKVGTFGDGVWIVGDDIAPGTYRTDGALSGLCDAKRLSGFSGEPDDVIASEVGLEPFIVTIEATDAGFSSENCDLWTDDTTPRTSSPTAGFGYGYWSVGDEVEPGLWLNKGPGEWCAWQRLRGFSWESDDTIASGAPYETFTVRIDAGDRGFFANEFCAPFTYVGP